MRWLNKKTPANQVALSGVLVALSLIFSYIESLISITAGVPGVKLGLANLVVLSCLYILNPIQVLIINIARILLAGFMFGNLYTIIYSLAGGILSFLIMLLFKKISCFSQVGVSIIGGVFHNLGQILVACLVLKSLNIFSYLPVLLISGTIAGALIGIVGKLVTRCIYKLKES